NDANDCNGNRDEEDVNEGDKDPNGSNLSFGFSKISLEDFSNDSGLAKKDKVVERNPTEQGTIIEGNEAEECEIMSTLENFTQCLEKNVDLVEEGDIFGDKSATLKAMNQEITPEKLPTQKASHIPKKRAVKPSSFLLSPYMNKKTNDVPKITRLEFILGNSLFAMQGDKIENVFEAHFGKFIVYGVRLNLESLAPGL
nr:ulp1 protease family, C-terminal catalytic domain-containing protein [Tanacetum cinerariifolium]